MAMEEDVDTVMGEAGSHPLPIGHGHPFPSDRFTGPEPAVSTPLNGNGTHDPVLAPPLLGPSLTVSLAPGLPSPADEHGTAQSGTRDVSPTKHVSQIDQPDGLTAVKEMMKRDDIVEPDSDWSDEEETAAAAAGLRIASLPTGLCYDHRMRYHCEPRPTHDLHPEDPRRIYYIYKELCKAGLVDSEDASRPLVPRPLQRIPVRNATEEEICLIHTPDHYMFVESTKGTLKHISPIVHVRLVTWWERRPADACAAEMTDEELVELEFQRDSIYFNKLTFATSLLSTGGAIETCLAVATRKVKNAIAVIRPPGHHAESDTAMGFCLFNNVSVAARVCQKQLGESCRKIMIVDWYESPALVILP